MTLTICELLTIQEKHPENIIFVEAKFDFDTKILLGIKASLVFGGINFNFVQIELPTTKAEKKQLAYTFFGTYSECLREEMPADGILRYRNFDAWFDNC